MITLILIVLIVPGLVCAYFFFVRPLLKSIPQLKQFYAEADGFWAKVSALGWHSASIAWGYFMMAFGAAMQLVDPLATVLGDPDFSSHVTALVGANPKVLGYFSIFVSLITIAARLRSIAKS